METARYDGQTRDDDGELVDLFRFEPSIRCSCGYSLKYYTQHCADEVIEDCPSKDIELQPKEVRHSSKTLPRYARSELYYQPKPAGPYEREQARREQAYKDACQQCARWEQHEAEDKANAEARAAIARGMK